MGLCVCVCGMSGNFYSSAPFIRSPLYRLIFYYVDDGLARLLFFKNYQDDDLYKSVRINQTVQFVGSEIDVWKDYVLRYEFSWVACS